MAALGAAVDAEGGGLGHGSVDSLVEFVIPTEVANDGDENAG
jgi:hypothetical protein